MTRVSRIFPLVVFGAVALYELLAFAFLRRISDTLNLLVDLVVFGILGPVVIWFTLRWITTQVEISDHARAAQAAAEAERQRALEAAREQERLLAAVCANSADAIITLDNAGIIKAWNRGAEMIFNYKPDQVVGKHFEILLLPEQIARGEIEWLNQQIRERGFVRNYQTTRVAQDGRRVIVDLTRTALHDARGEHVGYSAIMRDITKRVETER